MSGKFDECALDRIQTFLPCLLLSVRDLPISWSIGEVLVTLQQLYLRAQNSSMPSAKWQAKMGNWHAKKYKFGWPNQRNNYKSKYSWIAKTNYDGTPNLSLISCPVST